LGIDFCDFHGDPIYDIDLDDSRGENAETLPLEKPSLFSAFLVQPCFLMDSSKKFRETLPLEKPSLLSAFLVQPCFFMDSSKKFQIREHIVDDESVKIYLGNLQPCLIKNDSVLFHLMGHMYDKKTSKNFQPHCLIDREEMLQSRGCNFIDENAKKNPSIISSKF
jgi:hypothetical protein